jgi:hypothetical protein
LTRRQVETLHEVLDAAREHMRSVPPRSARQRRRKHD